MSISIKDITRGTTRAVDVTFLQADGTPYNLTGATVRFIATLQDTPTNDSTAAINVSTMSHTDPTNGKTRILLTATDTNVAAERYNVGIQAALIDGTVVENTGKVKILQDYVKE